MSEGRQRSEIWSHFRRTGDMSRSECRICHKKISHSAGSTNNLHRHMRLLHPDIVVEKILPESHQDEKDINDACDDSDPDYDPNSTIIAGSEEITREFIELRYKLRHLFTSQKNQCQKAYSRILNELGLQNEITAMQASKKWSNILLKYKEIKGGYSTSRHPWPHFETMDQLVPLMRKELIVKVDPLKTNKSRQQDDPQSPAENTLEEDAGLFSMPAIGVEGDEEMDECKTEAGEEIREPPKKRRRSRLSAQRARNKWWGLVETEEGTPDSGKGTNSDQNTSMHTTSSTSLADSLPASQMELRTFDMLETCCSSLVEIRDLLRGNAEQQENLVKSVQEAVAKQSDQMKELMSAISSQNTTLINLLTQLTNNSRSLSNQ